MTHRDSRLPSRLHALAFAATLALAAPPVGAINTFTGLAPVYLGSWYNGTSIERVEFQYALDWQGWCNARPGADCQRIAFWNVAGNWDSNAVPNPFSGEVRVKAGDTVRVGTFNSIYHGVIAGGNANILSAEGRVEIGSFSGLGVANATFADLYNFGRVKAGVGQLATSGLSTISLLSSGTGDFGGAGGTTSLRGWQPSNVGDLQLLVRAGHTLEMNASGPSSAQIAIYLQPEASMRNLGLLRMNGGFVSLDGSAGLSTLPVFNNSGTLAGSGILSSTRFNNSGSVQLEANEALALGLVGNHSGSFTAAAGSQLSFGGVAGPSQQFLAGSSVNSSGTVVAGRGRHQVSGNWNVANMRLQDGSQVSFDGPVPQIGVLEVVGNSNNSASFNSNGGVQLQTATLNEGYIEFNHGNNTVQNLNLVQGSLVANSALAVAQALEWQSGFLVGPGPVTLPGQVNLLDGTRGMAATVDLSGTLNWQAGSFSQWSGAMSIGPTGRFFIQGDFSSAGGGGSLTNLGLIEKTAGPGRAELAMAVNSSKSGVFKVQSGTLALTGGGLHDRASFEALTGARIELSGGTVFSSNVSRTGRLDIVGGSLALQNGVQYTHGAGHRLDIDGLSLQAGTRLDTPDALVVNGNVINNGTLAPAASVTVLGDFQQLGNFSLAPGANLSVGGNGVGVFTNARPLVLTNSGLFANELRNTSTLTLTGDFYAQINRLQNDGQLNIVSGVFSYVGVGTGVNSGTLRLDGASSALSLGGSFVNSGTIVNEGLLESGTSFTHLAGSRMDNIGQLTVYGDLVLAAGSQLTNTGRLNLNQYGGKTVVNGRLVAGQGLDIQAGELRGNGTVQGSVNLGAGTFWRPGNSLGTFTVVGDAYVNGGLEIEVDSLALHDRLVVSGNFFLNGSGALNFLFGNGFQAQQDGDRITWLEAAYTSVGGAVSFNGLPAYWSANIQGGVVELTYDLANAIPLSGSHSIAANQVGFNAMPGPFNIPALDQLDNAGTFSNRTGAAARIDTFNNTGLVLNRGSLQSFTTVSNAGEWRNLSGSSVMVTRLENTGQWQHGGTGFVMTLDNRATGRIELLSGSSLEASYVNNEGDMTVLGALRVYGGIANRGRFEVAAGGSVIADPDAWNYPGGYVDVSAQAVTRVDGLLHAGQIKLNGRLQGSGTLRGNVIAGSDVANINPGNSVGTLTIEGNLQPSPWGGAQLNLEIDSAQSYDRLIVTGNANIGSLYFLLPTDFRPGAGDSFSVLSVGGVLDGLGTTNWAIYRIDYSGGLVYWGGPGGVSDPYTPGAANLRLSFANGTLSVTAVPEPHTWALMLGGLLAMGWFKRRSLVA